MLWYYTVHFVQELSIDDICVATGPGARKTPWKNHGDKNGSVSLILAELEF